VVPPVVSCVSCSNEASVRVVMVAELQIKRERRRRERRRRGEVMCVCCAAEEQDVEGGRVDGMTKNC